MALYNLRFIFGKQNSILIFGFCPFLLIILLWHITCSLRTDDSPFFNFSTVKVVSGAETASTRLAYRSPVFKWFETGRLSRAEIKCAGRTVHCGNKPRSGVACVQIKMAT